MSAQYKDGKYYGTGGSPMPAEDMAEVASPLPSVMSRRFKYSTEEQIVGEWIDGKPLYQRTFDCGTGPARATKTIAIDNISEFDNVFIHSGFAIASGYMYPIPSTSSNVTYQLTCYVNKSSGIVLGTVEDDYSPYNCYVTLQYTKTTD